MEQMLQPYLDGNIVRTGVHSYEVRTSHGTGKGATVAEALKDLADKQVLNMANSPQLEKQVELESKAKVASPNIETEDVKQEPVEKPKKRKSKKTKKSE